ncbi:NAD(P)H-flavin reductase [Endozoicomonas arenosclerae]|uniref:NAD(P)H-flavin reductase n=1 Tax=Endozoicomonas arenosclerae TaxID=1633495 RepID=UPI000ADC84E0|nr:NAD(P)H-flavin reductase [Endozoicomonas arenosclerae]
MQRPEPVTLHCSVADTQLLSSDIYRIKLATDSGFFPDYYPGQYLVVHLQNNESSCFSIASSPRENQQQLELHIQKLKDSPNSQQLFQEIKQGSLNISLPQGRCHLPPSIDSQQPLLFVAAGTGFAQMKSMIEHCLHIGHQGEMHLYWGARTPGDFYLPNLPIQWSGKGLHYHPVVSEAIHEDDWCGRHGLLYEAILADRKKLLNCETFISGSPRMVYTTYDAMIENSFPEKSLSSDVFDYAPRK